MNENSSMRRSSVPSISPNGSYCEYISSCTYLLILKQYLKRQHFFSFQEDFIKNLSICPLPLTRSPHTHGQLCIYVLFHKHLRRAFGSCEVKKKKNPTVGSCELRWNVNSKDQIHNYAGKIQLQYCNSNNSSKQLCCIVSHVLSVD